MHTTFSDSSVRFGWLLACMQGIEPLCMDAFGFWALNEKIEGPTSVSKKPYTSPLIAFRNCLSISLQFKLKVKRAQ